MMPGPSLLITGLLSLALGVGANPTTPTNDLTASTITLTAHPINLTAHPACVFNDDCRDFSARAVCFIYFCVDWDEEVLMTKCSDNDVCESSEHCKEVRKTRSGKQGLCFSGKACSGHSDCSVEEPYCMMEEDMEGGFCGPEEYYTARQQDCDWMNTNFCKAALLGDHCCLDFSGENSTTRCCSHPLPLVMPGEGDEAGTRRLESAMQEGGILEDKKRKICEEEEPEELVKRGLASCLQFTSTTTTTTTTTTATTVKPSKNTPEEDVKPVYDHDHDHDHRGDMKVMKEAVMPLKGSATSLNHGGSVILALVSTSLIVFRL